MKMTLEDTRAVLSPFAILFPLPTQANGDELVAIWHSLLKEFYRADVMLASRRLAAKLTRFPYPADLIQEMAGAPCVGVQAGTQSAALQSIDTRLTFIELQLKRQAAEVCACDEDAPVLSPKDA
ncbi:MAG: hypothetical protein K2X55_21450 [Burkholderiaceae bacterium]|nr:hypothetical protein [Burkholderiaceae bacterium]